MLAPICRHFTALTSCALLALTDFARASETIFKGYPEWTSPLGWSKPLVDSVDLPMTYKLQFDFYQNQSPQTSNRRQEFEVKLGGDYYNDRVDDLPSVTFFTEANGDAYIEITLRIGSRGDENYSRNALYIDVPAFGDSDLSYSQLTISMQLNGMIVELNGEIAGLFQFDNSGQNGCYQTMYPQKNFKCDRNIQNSENYVAQEFYGVPGYFWAQTGTEAFIRNLMISTL